MEAKRKRYFAVFLITLFYLFLNDKIARPITLLFAAIENEEQSLLNQISQDTNNSPEEQSTLRVGPPQSLSNQKKDEEFKEKAIQQLKDLNYEISSQISDQGLDNSKNTMGVQGEEAPFEILRKQLNPSENEEYKIMKQDNLLITVWDNPDLFADTIVRPDGRISFPLIGDVLADGLTITQLDSLVTERLKKFVRKPEVSIVIKNLAGKKISVLGEVSTPGVYRVMGEGRILEVIAQSGGFTSSAVLKRVIVIRPKPEPRILLVDLNKAIQQADFTQNIVLETDDVVYISKKFIANINYFLNQVFGPLTDEAIKIQDLTGSRR